MKRYNSLKRIGTAALSLLLLLALAAPALAAESSATFYGRARLFEFDPEDGSPTGLFNNLQGLMPGGKYTQKITVRNAHSQRTDIYLRGEPVGVSSPGQKDIGNLLDLVEFTLLDESGTLIVSKGSLSRTWPGSGGTTHEGYRYIDLGRFSTGADETLTLELTIPPELNNDYQNAKGTVEWTFLANIYEPDDDDDDDRPRRTIPLGPGIEIIIDDEPIPLAPGTGDETNLYLWAGGFVALSLALAVLIAKRRRAS